MQFFASPRNQYQASATPDKFHCQGSADAAIFSAFPMSEAQVAALIATLEKKFKIKLTPSVTVDPSLIGGLRVVVNDEVLDTSIRTRLEQMRVALTA